jgi:thiamine biosynthesis lipoprotein
MHRWTRFLERTPMRRRTLISASLGFGALVYAGGVHRWADAQAGFLAPAPDKFAGLKLYSGSELAFGTTITIKLMHADATQANEAIADALSKAKMVDALMSLHQERSQVFQLNRSGVLKSPDSHLLFVLRFAQKMSRLTGGAFDITVQPLWRAFSLAKTKASLPTPDEVALAKSLVNWHELDVQQHVLRLNTAGMAITLNGVAQGYAVDLAREALRARGVQHALIDTGEFGAIGDKTSDHPWELGIANPRKPESMSNRLKMDTRSVATSGDYETFFSPDFVHHHIFDPNTGDSPTELASVTVIAPTGILADGLSTALMVMGADKALQLVAKWPDVDVMLVGKNGSIKKTENFGDC